MSQFDFIKPIVRFDEELIKDTGFEPIFGVKFFSDEIRKEKHTHYRKDGVVGDKKTFLVENHISRAADEVTEEQWELFKQFDKERSQWNGLIIGAIYCPFTDNKLRDIRIGIPERKNVSLNYADETGEVLGRKSYRYRIVNPRKVTYGNEMSRWYAPEVLAVMFDEWSYDNSGAVDMKAPDLTVLSESIDRVIVLYNRRGYSSIEDIRVYLSTNGRHFKNRGTKNVYLDSKPIENFKQKIREKQRLLL